MSFKEEDYSRIYVLCTEEISSINKPHRKLIAYDKVSANEKLNSKEMVIMSKECHEMFASLVNAAVEKSVYKYSSKALAYCVTMLCGTGYIQPELFSGEDVKSIQRLWEVISNALSEMRIKDAITSIHMDSLMSDRSGEGYKKFMTNYSTLASVRKSNSTTEELKSNYQAKESILGDTMREIECLSDFETFSLVKTPPRGCDNVTFVCFGRSQTEL